jgi:hypothetical protein
MKPRPVNGCPGRRLEAFNLSSRDHVHHRIARAPALHADRPIRPEAPTGGSDQSHSCARSLDLEGTASRVAGVPFISNASRPLRLRLSATQIARLGAKESRREVRIWECGESLTASPTASLRRTGDSDGR